MYMTLCPSNLTYFCKYINYDHNISILYIVWFIVNSFPACDDFCRLLIAFSNSLDPDLDRQNVSLELDPNGLTP